MLTHVNFDKIDSYSLKFLFHLYKKDRNDSLLNAIYRRTFNQLFEDVFLNVSTSSEAASIVQDVYRNAKSTLSSNEKETCVFTYLRRLADGCMLINSHN